MHAVALYDYDGREEDELSIEAGEDVHVIARHDDGWFLVQNAQGAFGVVPGNYLQMSRRKAETAAPEPAPAGLEGTARPGADAKLDSDSESMWQVFVVVLKRRLLYVLAGLSVELMVDRMD